jgi:RNA polymerase sigma-70 factor (ECF subfamily)
VGIDHHLEHPSEEATSSPERERRNRSAEADVDSSMDLWTAIRRLPKRQAQAVVLYYLADLPLRDVAVVMGCREGTAKAHLDRARKHLAASIEPPTQITRRDDDAG